VGMAIWRVEEEVAMKTSLWELWKFFYALGDGITWVPPVKKDSDCGIATFESEASARAFKELAPRWDVATRWQRIFGYAGAA